MKRAHTFYETMGNAATNQDYSFKHWMGTLLFAPLLLLFYDLDSSVASFLMIYSVYFLFSLIFSLPVFILHYFILTILIARQVNPWLSKTILIVLTILGIVGLLQSLRALTEIYFIPYSSSALITGIILRIRQNRV